MQQIPIKIMLLFIISAFCLLLPVRLLDCAENDEPSIVLVEDEYVLTLTEEQWSAIRTYNPEFRIRELADYLPLLLKWYQFSEHQLPYAVIGDFNGDGRNDVVLHGHNKVNEFIIAVLSSNSGPNVMEIERFPLILPRTAWYGMGNHREYGVGTYLWFFPKGMIHSPYEENPLQLSTDGFQLCFFEKASTLYYLKGSSFQKYITGD